MKSPSEQNNLVFSQKGLAFRNEVRHNYLLNEKESKMKQNMQLKQMKLDEVKNGNDLSYLDISQQSQSKIANDVTTFMTRNGSTFSNEMSQKLMVVASEMEVPMQKQYLKQLLLQDIDVKQRNSKYICQRVEDYSHQIVKPLQQQQNILSQSAVHSRKQDSQHVYTHQHNDNSLLQSSRQRSLSPQLVNLSPSKRGGISQKNQIRGSHEINYNLYNPEEGNNEISVYKKERNYSIQHTQSKHQRSQSNDTSLNHNSSFNSVNDSFLQKKYSFIINAENKIQKMIQRYDSYDQHYQQIQGKVKQKSIDMRNNLEGSIAQSHDLKKHIDNQNLLEVLLRQTKYQQRKKERIKAKQQFKYEKQWKNMHLPSIPHHQQKIQELNNSQQLPDINRPPQINGTQKYEQNDQFTKPNKQKKQSIKFRIIL